MEEKLMGNNAPTLEGTLKANKILIADCLKMANILYTELTSDKEIGNTEIVKAECIMSEVIGQHENLAALRHILLSLKATIVEQSKNESEEN